MWIYSKWTACLLSLTWARGWTTSAAALLSMAACRGCRAAVTAASSRSSICFLSGSAVEAKCAWKGWKHRHEDTRIRNIQVTFNDVIWSSSLSLISAEFCLIWFLFVVVLNMWSDTLLLHRETRLWWTSCWTFCFGCKELNLQQLIGSLNSCQIWILICNYSNSFKLKKRHTD